MIKEIKSRPQISEEDYAFKLGHAIHFLEDHYQLRILITFRGRELAHQKLGERLLLRYAGDLEAYATAQLPPIIDGRQMFMIFTPKSVVVSVL